VLIAETGGDMSRFPSPDQLSAWVGLAAAVHEPAGKRIPSGTRGQQVPTSMLVEAANSASRSKNTYLAAQFKRLATRRGHGRAAVAFAHSMLVSAYWMLVRDEPYQDLGPDWLASATTRRTHGAWSPSSNASATPSSSTQPPGQGSRKPVAGWLIRAKSGCCRAHLHVIQGSVAAGDLDR
jgi:hypothetical protein